MKIFYCSTLLLVITLLHTACRKDAIDNNTTEPATLNKILYQSEDASTGLKQLYIIDDDGSNTTKLTNSTTMSAAYADWSTDGKEVLFYYGSPNNPWSSNNLYSVAIDGSGMRQITNIPSGNISKASLSPDNTTIVYQDGFTLFTIDTDGSNKTQLTDPNTLQVGYMDNLSWSADGTAINFTAQADPSLPYERYTINPDGTGLTPLGGPSGDYTIVFYNNNKMAFIMPSTTTNTSQLFEANLDGTNQVQLTNDADQVILGASLSPNKSQLLLEVYVHSTSKIEFFTINTDGSNQRKIVPNNNQTITQANWSPDGNKIVFSAYRNIGYQTDLFMINADGTGLTAITDNLQAELFPVWR